MASVQIAAAGTGNGTTAGVAVTEARCYSVQVTWNGVGTQPTVFLEVSVDGTNYFRPVVSAVGPLYQGLSSNAFVYRLADLPVTKMRMAVSGLSTGTYTAFVSAV